MSVLARIDLAPAATAASVAVSSLPPAASRAGASPLPASNVEAIRAAAAELDAFMRSSNQSIVFAVDKSTGQVIVSVQDAATGQTIRQIPNEVLLRIAQELKQNKSIASLLLDTKA